MQQKANILLASCGGMGTVGAVNLQKGGLANYSSSVVSTSNR